MKKHKLIGLGVGLLLCVSSIPYAMADCTTDVTQMRYQISHYFSIMTKGCSVYPGIIRVSNASAIGKQCKATCSYNKFSVACHWQTGNWGNTLTCKYPQ